LRLFFHGYILGFLVDVLPMDPHYDEVFGELIQPYLELSFTNVWVWIGGVVYKRDLLINLISKDFSSTNFDDTAGKLEDVKSVTSASQEIACLNILTFENREFNSNLLQTNADISSHHLLPKLHCEQRFRLTLYVDLHLQFTENKQWILWYKIISYTSLVCKLLFPSRFAILFVGSHVCFQNHWICAIARTKLETWKL
jgi:hypothetical protein